VDDASFPFTATEITPELVIESFEYSRKIWEPLITQASPEIRGREIKSVLGR